MTNTVKFELSDKSEVAIDLDALSVHNRTVLLVAAIGHKIRNESRSAVVGKLAKAYSDYLLTLPENKGKKKSELSVDKDERDAWGVTNGFSAAEIAVQYLAEQLEMIADITTGELGQREPGTPRKSEFDIIREGLVWTELTAIIIKLGHKPPKNAKDMIMVGEVKKTRQMLIDEYLLKHAARFDAPAQKELDRREAARAKAQAAAEAAAGDGATLSLEALFA